MQIPLPFDSRQSRIWHEKFFHKSHVLQNLPLSGYQHENTAENQRSLIRPSSSKIIFLKHATLRQSLIHLYVTLLFDLVREHQHVQETIEDSHFLFFSLINFCLFTCFSFFFFHFYFCNSCNHI